MEKIKVYKVGDSGTLYYLIDSNIILAMCQYYYRGYCKDSGLTNELIDFIRVARVNNIDYQNSLMEVCYDYNQNSIDNEQMGLVMLAINNLIMNFSDKEFFTHKGTNKPENESKKKQVCLFNSIYECNLPFLLYKDEIDTIDCFFGTYLCFLKIYDLYFENISGIEKIYALYFFMTEDMGKFLLFEFNLATMLFIGKSSEKDIASGIIKPLKKPDIRHIMNAVIDIMSYRKAYDIVICGRIVGKKIQVKFVTCDIALQKYVDLYDRFFTVIDGEYIASLMGGKFRIKSKYKFDWDLFYLNNIESIIRLCFCPVNSNIERKIKTEIIKLEKKIIYGSIF